MTGPRPVRAPRGTTLTDRNWPVPLDDTRAATLRVALRDILDACMTFATGHSA